MAVKDIKQITKQIKTELRTNGKKCISYIILQQSYMMLGALMFFYVEECYFKVQSPENKHNPCIQLCSGIHKLNQSGYLINSISTNASTTTHNESLKTIFQKMMNNCQIGECKESNIQQFQKRCELDRVGFVTWSVYTFTVIYTIGKKSHVEKKSKSLVLIFSKEGR